MKIAALASICLLLAGCSTMIGSPAHSTISKFDGSRSVWIAPHGTNCGWSMTCDSVGAEWNSADPNLALLQVEFMGDYTSIQAVFVNIDGHILKLEPIESTHLSNPNLDYGSAGYVPGYTAMLRTSDRYFAIPLSAVRQIAMSRHVTLRAQLGDGTLDSIIVEGNKDSKAYYALKRFLKKIDQIRARATSTPAAY